MKITTKYNHEDIVFLITDGDQREHIVTEVRIKPNNSIAYLLVSGSEESEHYEFEISPDCDVKKKTSN